MIYTIIINESILKIINHQAVTVNLIQIQTEITADQ